MSSTLPYWRFSSVRSAGESPRPNSRWNSLRGLYSIGSGVFGERYEMVPV